MGMRNVNNWFSGVNNWFIRGWKLLVYWGEGSTNNWFADSWFVNVNVWFIQFICLSKYNVIIINYHNINGRH